MYLRILRLKIDPRFNNEMASIEDRVSQFYVPHRGCVWSRFIVQRDMGIWGNVSLWRDLAQLEEVRTDPVLRKISEECRPLLLEPPQEEIYEVYEPKKTGS